ncbi:GldG family protein [Saccharibacillus alkalitolerans]|uniref:GldG family protein n=1 Tax=Saccharibacillus alkalitolerans TaxID=2705290 RepID=A0ABX0F9J2_9BACL|nr:GldG family protein [Saccharibacillus alkalitolerans]NGZ76644.1 GldG family protein [Saccharibacillus alkalitolerans]
MNKQPKASNPNSRRILHHANTLVVAIASIGIFVLLTLFLNKASEFQLDLTANKQYTLSDQTNTVLGRLPDTVKLEVFTHKDGDGELVTREVTDLVQEYAKKSSKLDVHTYSLVQQPELARQYNLSSSSVVLTYGKKSQTITFREMFGSGDSSSYTFLGESKLTSALNSLISTEQRKAYLLAGHGEFDLTRLTQLTAGLKADNTEVSELQLYQAGKIPDDADLLMIVAPENDLSDKELKLIETYLDGKGKLFLSLGFNPDMKAAWKNIDALMKKYGVTDEHAVAVDRTNTQLYDPLTVVPSYESHKITEKLRDGKVYPMTYLSVALNAAAEAPKGLTVSPLLSTSAESYGETDLAGLLQSKSEYDKGTDLSGPLYLGYAVDDADGNPKAVLLGTSYFLTDDQIAEQGNKDFALNSINYLSGNQSDLTIRAREQQQYETAYLTAPQARYILIGTMIVFPLAFVLIGLLFWWRRRRV